MSDIDLTEAVEVAQDDLTRTFGKAVRAHRSEPAVDLADGSTVFPHPIAQALVEKVAQLIERQVREQIARKVGDLEHDRDEMRERLAQGLSVTWAEGYDTAVRDAARIARGGAS